MRLTGENTLNSTRWHTTVWKYFIYTWLYFRLCLGFAAIITNPSNVTTCLGSSATFTCAVNETKTINWLINDVIVIPNALNGFKIYTPNNQSSILSIPIINLFQQSVQCYVNSPFAYSLKAFLSVQAPPSAPTNVTSTILNRTSVVLAWEQVYNAQPTSLSYVVLVTNGSGAVVNNVTVTKPPVTIPTPDPCDHYEATVTATYTSVVNCSGNGTTIQLVEAPPSAPTNLTTTRLNATSVKLAWAYSSQSPVLSYIVLVTNSSGASVFSRTVMEPPVNIPTPDPCDHYKATVTATYTSVVNCSGNGTTINIVGGSTCEPNATSSTSSQQHSSVTPAATSTTSSQRLSSGGIVGIAISVIVVISMLVVIIGSIIYCRRGRKCCFSPKRNEPIDLSSGADKTGESPADTGNNGATVKTPETPQQIASQEQEMELEFVPQNPDTGNNEAPVIPGVLPVSMPSLQNKSNKQSSLMMASDTGQEEVVKKLLEAGADINLKEGTNGQSSLMLASMKGHVKIVKMLLSKGAQVDLQDDDGKSSLMKASMEGHVKVVEILLLAGADCNLQDMNGQSSLMLASMKSQVEIVEMLLSKGAQVDQHDDHMLIFQRSSLMFASMNGHVHIVEMLLSAGAKVDLQGLSKQTALMYASMKGHVKVVEMLLSKGADIDLKDEYGNSSLILASMHDYVEVVEMLISKGAQVDLQNKDGKSSLMWASMNDHVEVVEVLLSKGAQVDLLNKNKQSSLMMASETGQVKVVKKLLEAGADINLQEGTNEWTSLMLASMKGHKEVVGVLLSKHANVNVQDKNGLSSLMMASSNGHKEVVKMLLLDGADVNLQGKFGQTAFTMASMKGHFEVVEILSKGAQVDVQNKI